MGIFQHVGPPASYTNEVGMEGVVTDLGNAYINESCSNSIVSAEWKLARNMTTGINDTVTIHQREM